MELSQEIKDQIKNNILHITVNMKNKHRNYLNKQLQDAVCNYFMENYAAVFLKEEYQIASGRELRKKIEKTITTTGKKYINLLNKFKSEIIRVNKGDEYRQMLVSIIYEEEIFSFESDLWCSLQRKKILALLLLVHWDHENILNFYDMWNAIFPDDPLIKLKMNNEEKEKIRIIARARQISDDLQKRTSKIRILSVTTKPINKTQQQEQKIEQKPKNQFFRECIFENSFINSQPQKIVHQKEYLLEFAPQMTKIPTSIINNHIFEEVYNDVDCQQNEFNSNISYRNQDLGESYHPLPQKYMRGVEFESKISIHDQNSKKNSIQTQKCFNIDSIQERNPEMIIDQNSFEEDYSCYLQKQSHFDYAEFSLTNFVK